MRALDEPADVILCETCIQYEEATRRGYPDTCKETGEPTIAMGLCEHWRDRERIKTMRRLNERPRRLTPPGLGHSFDADMICDNFRRLAPASARARSESSGAAKIDLIYCGRSWAQHTDDPQLCAWYYPWLYSVTRIPRQSQQEEESDDEGTDDQD